MRFGLIGDGHIAQYHRAAIGDRLINVYDPKYCNGQLSDSFFKNLDVAVICSPSYMHYQHIKLALRNNCKVIVEKPYILPWEPEIDDDRINIVLQLRHLDLPDKASQVSVTMVRDEDYFKSWKGDPQLTGGIFYNLFVHYIDIANRLGADFCGKVASEGKQSRLIDGKDILNVDMAGLYDAMYRKILTGLGTKPKDIRYLNYVMAIYSQKYGFGRNAVGKEVYIPNQMP